MSTSESIHRDTRSSRTLSFSRILPRLTILNTADDNSQHRLAKSRSIKERFGDKTFEIKEEEPPAKYVKKGDHVDDVLCREPSFTKFRVPYQIICANRYRAAMKRYENQINREIKQNIDFQPTAADACYYVRCMAVTTFWPPLHNRHELNHTSNHFYNLSPKERSRFQTIMCTDII